MRWLLAIMALAGVAMAGAIYWMETHADYCPEPILPPGIGSPVLAIELARTPDDIADVLRHPTSEHNRGVMRGQVAADWPFIAGYAAFLGGWGLIEAIGRQRVARTLGIAALACIALAAALDVVENLAILRALEIPWMDLSEADALGIRRPSLLKWTLLWAGCLLICPVFLRARDLGSLDGVAWASGVGFLLSGLLGMIGLAIPAAIGSAVTLLALPVAATFLAFCLPALALLLVRPTSATGWEGRIALGFRGPEATSNGESTPRVVSR